MEGLGFINEVATMFYCDNMASIIMDISKKPTDRDSQIDNQNFDLREWFDPGQLVLEHFSTYINV